MYPGIISPRHPSHSLPGCAWRSCGASAPRPLAGSAGRSLAQAADAPCRPRARPTARRAAGAGSAAGVRRWQSAGSRNSNRAATPGGLWTGAADFRRPARVQRKRTCRSHRLLPASPDQSLTSHNQIRLDCCILGRQTLSCPCLARAMPRAMPRSGLSSVWLTAGRLFVAAGRLAR